MRRLEARGERMTEMDDSDLDLHFGRCLHRRRRQLGLTQQQVAWACGISFQQIQKYECGSNRISAARLWQLAEALAVPVTYFYDGLSSKAELEGRSDHLHSGMSTVELAKIFDELGEPSRKKLLDLSDTLLSDSHSSQ